MSRTVTCPGWCAEHRCTSRYALGEHRSEPLMIARPGVGLVVSLTQRTDRPYPVVEFRLSIRLRSRTPEGQVAELTALIRRLSRLLTPGGSR